MLLIKANELLATALYTRFRNRRAVVDAAKFAINTLLAEYFLQRVSMGVLTHHANQTGRRSQ